MSMLVEIFSNMELHNTKSKLTVRGYRPGLRSKGSSWGKNCRDLLLMSLLADLVHFEVP
jgi:hypothetical protein